MNDAIKIRLLQGDPIVHDVRNVQFPTLYRGWPKIEDKNCIEGCNKCAEVCPTNAIKLNPLQIDLGLCVFCPLCEETCPEKIIQFTSAYQFSASSREQLLISKETTMITPEIASEK